MATTEQLIQWKQNWERQFYPGTSTLVNLINERDPVRLQNFEHRKTMEAGLALSKNPIQGDYGLEHMAKIHHALFKDVYPFAGEVRDFGMRKKRINDPVTSRFARPDEFPILNTLLKERVVDVLALKNEDFVRNPKQHQQAFVDGISKAYETANELHPFREGNGRTQRVWLNQLAKEVGWQLDYSKIEPRAWNYAAAQSTPGEINGQHVAGKVDKLQQVFGHIAVHEKALHNPYIQGKLGDLAPKQRVLEVGELSPLQSRPSIRM